MTHSHTRMTPATLEALQGSIRKWEDIVAGRDHDRGAENCPLCLKFNRDWLDLEYDDSPDEFDEKGPRCCAGCPVAEFTGKDMCDDTPYSQGRFVAVEINGKDTHQPDAATAQAELDFLKSLLPAAQSDEKEVAP